MQLPLHKGLALSLWGWGYGWGHFQHFRDGLGSEMMVGGVLTSPGIFNCNNLVFTFLRVASDVDVPLMKMITFSSLKCI